MALWQEDQDSPKVGDELVSEAPVRQPEAPSKFIQGTLIQWAWAIEKAIWLLTLSTAVGDCWECHLTPNAKGYSYVSFGRYSPKWRVHRLIYAVFVGTIEEPMVLHTCDNRRCINPDHLYQGSAADNTRDMLERKGWKNDPESNHRQKEATASYIASLHKRGLTKHDIIDRYGISNTTYWNYTRGPYKSFLAKFEGADRVG